MTQSTWQKEFINLSRYHKSIYSDIWTAAQIEDAKKLPGPILIIGVSGFIGSKLYFSLRNIRDDVYGSSRTPEFSWRFTGINDSHLLNMDITNYENTRHIIQNFKPQTVFNLSQYGGYARQTDVLQIHHINYLGTLNLIRILSETGCSAFIQTGSSSEYGTNCIAPSENDELIPNSDYAVSKVGASYLIKYYGKFNSFPCVNLRLYSIYGPWEERDRLISVLISHCLKGQFPPFAHETISRDFVYIDDCNHAMVKAALTTCKTHPGVSLNIATGQKTSLKNIAELAKHLFDIPGEPIFGAMQNRKWDLANWFGSCELSNSVLGWTAQTTLQTGLQLTAKWEKEASPVVKYVFIPQKTKRLSAILACYRDHEAIPIMYERLTQIFRNLNYDYEIIFVNDASPTQDEEVIFKLSQKDPHVIGITHSRNFGSQSAFLSGMAIASGDAVILFDGDGQDPPELLPDFVQKWEDGFDIVYGQRVKREAKLYMQILYKIFYRIFSLLADVVIPRDAGDFSLIDHKAVTHILNFSEKDVFLRGLRAWIGFQQVGVPYVRPDRLFGHSTNSFLKNIWWAKKGIFSFSMKPLHYIQGLGITFFFITLLLGLFYLIYYFIIPPSESSRGITTIVLLMLGLGSVQILSLSIIGDYIGKILEEVKNRPKFIRKKIIMRGESYDTKEKMKQLITQRKIH